MTIPFPARIPLEKPTDRPLSAAVQRLYDEWNPHEDWGNPLFSNFRYSSLEGLDYDGTSTSRRDPSKILRINGTYYVWYTKRCTAEPPAGADSATATVPSTDWDLAEIWYATSRDGFTWQERGCAVERAPGRDYGWRSVSTPDILVWRGRYYLYFQGFNEIPGKRWDRAAVTVAEADSPHGPWTSLGRVVVDFGKEGEWDSAAIHDPYPIVYNGRIHLYYKGSPGTGGRDGTIVRAQGVATADHPFGPFEKCPLNPVINSGHETGLFPYEEGVAAIVSLDGPEKNTVQYAPDGVNFEMKAMIQVPPMAPGPFVPDAFADNRDGHGITWGLCHVNVDGGGGDKHCKLLRFDCDLSKDVDRPLFKRNNLRFEQSTYREERIAMSDWLRRRTEEDRQRAERDTILEHNSPSSDPRSVDHPGTAEHQLGIRERSTGESGAELVLGDPRGNTDPERSATLRGYDPRTPHAPAFPARMPDSKPTDRPLSASWARMWDRWTPHEDRGNELYSNFRYTPVKGLATPTGVSRRDPTKVIRVNGTYYVWYTRRDTGCDPVGQQDATDSVPATDWDLADIWYATSTDGITWQEQGLAVHRPPKPGTGWRSICTPDILVWEGRYYLYFQAYSDVCCGTIRCPVRVASADSPNGPWTLEDAIPIEPGPPGAWDNIKINDPYLLVHNGRILLYYKGAPVERGDEYVLRMQGVAMADSPLGPFVKSPLNPVINSGHETGLFPWKEGVAAIVSLDGPEKNTIQYAPDGENFEVMSIIQVPPVAPGPCVPDAFADNADGRGITWGLCHINPDGGGPVNGSVLARFDCDLSLDVDWPDFKRNNLRFSEATHLQSRIRLPNGLRQQILAEQDDVDKDTIGVP